MMNSDTNTSVYEEDEEEDMLVSQLNMDISNQYVVFSVATEEYGIPILSVQEIISLPNLTKIPGSPEYIPGIINLRGKIIPLYLLRERFGHEIGTIDSNTIVIITQIGNDNSKIVGFLVDSVSDVISITDENLSETPEFSTVADTKFIEKIGKIGNRMIVVISLTKFFTDSEDNALENTIKSFK